MGEKTIEVLQGRITILIKHDQILTFRISAENQNSRVLTIDTEKSRTGVLYIDLGEPTLVCPSPVLSLSSPYAYGPTAHCNPQGQVVY